MTKFTAMIRSLFSRLKRLAGGIFGHIQYAPPPWLQRLAGGSMRLCRRHGRALLVTAVVLAAGTFGGVKWWQWKEAHRARPDAVVNVIHDVDVTAENPASPTWNKDSGHFTPSDLRIAFSKVSAPLGTFEKGKSPPQPTGISLTPQHPGAWRWAGELSLAFTPSTPWPPGRRFTVTLEPAFVLKPEVRLTSRSLTVTAAPLTARVGNMEFYIDPSDPAIQQVVGSVTVSHPLAKEELDRHLRLTVVGGTALFATDGPPWTLVPDKDEPRHWWVRSPQVNIPAKEDFAVLTVVPGLTSADGGEPLATEAADKIVVRDKFSAFDITETSGGIVSGLEGEPIQHLFISTKGYAKPADFISRLEVRHLAAHSDLPAWDAPTSIPAEVLSAAPVLKITPVPPESPITSTHSWRLPPLTPGQLLVVVKKGLPAIGGYELVNDFTALTAVPEFPISLEFTTQGGLLSLQGERKFALKSRGVSHIRYTIARIPVSQVNHLASMTRGRFESPSWQGYAFSQENIAHIRHLVVPTGQVNDYDAKYNTFDFREHLEAVDPADPDASRGMFFLTAQAVKPRVQPIAGGTEKAAETENADDESGDPDWQRVAVTRSPLRSFRDQDHGDNRNNSSDDSPYGPSRFILVTDLGLVIKDNNNGSRDIFVQAIRNGGPAAAVALTIVAKNGEAIATATTAEDGHAHMDSTADFTGDRQPVVLTARRGNDVAFLPLNRLDRQLDYSRFDTGGLTSGLPGTLDAFVFTERGVYRPSDTVHASLIVRPRAGGAPPVGLPVTVLVRNAASRTVFQQTLTLPPDGMLDCHGTLRETDPTGLFTLQVLLFPGQPDPGLIGRTVFRVEDFQPDRMKLKADLPGVPAPNTGWRTDPDISAMLDLQTLFGFPAAGRRITGKLDLAPADFRFAAYPNYTFFDRTPINLSAGHERNLGETKTGEDGSAKFGLGLTNLADVSLAFTFTAEAFEPDSGRSVAVAKSGLLSPMATLTGWKPDGDLTYIGKDATRRIHLITLGPDLKLVVSPMLTQTLTIARHLSVLTKRENGSYAYISTPKREVVSKTTLTIPVEGLDLTLPTNETGDFRIEFRDPEDRLAAACDFSVTGKGEGSRSLEQNAELDLKIAGSDWQSGDDLELSLRAPFTGGGLLTIEREKVLGYRWFRSAEKESIQTIRVPDGIEGTAYVHAAFVRAIDSPEVFMSPLSYAVQPFRANYDKRLLPLTLIAPDRIRPGEILHVKLTSPVPARAVIYAVDEGIHQITDYQLPKPRDFFLRPRALEVTTTQILDLLMPEFTILGRSRAFGGGDEGEEALNLNLNPFQRKREAPVVFWSGLVQTGPDGITVDYAVPDSFAGQLTLMAVAAGLNGYGSTQAKTVVRGPFVLTPNAPLFAAPGDTFTLSLTIANNLESANPAATRVTPSLIASPNIVVTNIPEPTDIAYGKEGTVRFDIAIQEPLGNATLTFKAEGNGASAARTVTLSVRPISPRLTTVQSGYYRLPDHIVKPQRSLYPEFASRQVSVAAVPLNLARGLATWLTEFPHNCTEQIISRAMPRILLTSDVSFGFDRASSVAELDKVFTHLRARQAASGRFGLWSNNAEAGFDFLTVYAADFLTTTKEAGFAVPEDMLAANLKSLREMAVLEPQTLTEQTTQARAIYLLTRNGEVTTNYLLNLRDTLDRFESAAQAPNATKTPSWHIGPAALWIASTHALLRQDKEATALLTEWKNAQKIPAPAWQFWQDQPLALNAIDLALLSRHFPEVAGNLNYEDLQPLLSGLEKSEYNTYSAACCIQALKSWSALQKQTGVQTSLTELTADAPSRLLAAPGSGLLSADFTSAASALQFGLLRPDGAPNLGAFYQVVESGFDRSLPTATLREGMEITRSLTIDGKPVTSAQVGDTVQLTLHLRNLGDAPIPDIAITDLLPGGWEVETSTLRPGPGGVSGADSVDMREDRTILYCRISGQESQQFTWQVRALCAGTVTLPPAFATSLYRPTLKARSLPGKFIALPR